MRLIFAGSKKGACQRFGRTYQEDSPLHRFLIIAGLALAFPLAGPAAAQSVIERIADGNEWTMEMGDRFSGRITLNPDGTGQMRLGILRRSVIWTGGNNQLCLVGTPDGDQCLTWQPEGAGFVAMHPEGHALRLVR